MSPHCPAIFLQHSRSADVIAAPGNTHAATGSAASISARAETPSLINRFSITSLSTADSKTQQAGKGFSLPPSRESSRDLGKGADQLRDRQSEVVGSLRASFRAAGAPESRRMPLPLGSGVRGCGGADLNRRGYDLTHLSMRVGLYLHPLEMLAIQPKSLKTLFGKSLLRV